MLSAYLFCGCFFVLYLVARLLFGNDDFYKESDILTLILGLLISLIIWPVGLFVDIYTWYQANLRRRR